MSKSSTSPKTGDSGAALKESRPEPDKREPEKRVQNLRAQQLSLNQLTQYMPVIEESIRKGLPPDHLSQTAFGAIMNGLVSGALTCFALLAEKGGRIQLAGTMVIQVLSNRFTGRRICNIVSLHSAAAIPDAEWVKAYRALEMFARANGCSRIEAVSSNPRAVQLAESLGFDKATALHKDILI